MRRIEKLTCIGDSITFGYGVRESDSWFDRLDKKLPFTMKNRGRNGAGLRDLLYTIHHDVVHPLPSHVLIFAGINDIIAGAKAKQLYTTLHALIDILRENKITPLLATLIIPKPHVVNTGWLDGRDYLMIKNEVNAFNTYLRNFSSQEDILLFDFGWLFEEKHTGSQLFPDGVHPNAQAHQLMTEYMLQILDPAQHQTNDTASSSDLL
ncbi:MAG TPA: hypothetical protein GX733_03805 [Tissierellia bacterium]|nr:hypothetical protein [Tissierellia bacterium]